MANQYLRILKDTLRHEDQFCERVHAPMTLGPKRSKKVAFNYDGSADMKGHTAQMQVETLEDESAALISLTGFRKVRRGREVGRPLRLGALSFSGQSDFPEPETRLDGYLLVMHEDGPTRLAGLTGDNDIVPLEGMTSGHVGDVAVAFLDAIGSHVCQRIRQRVLED